MSKSVKIWLIIATSLVITGCIIFGTVLTILGWDFMKLSTSKYETNRYEISEAYSNITIVSDTADVKLVASDSTAIECYEQEKAKHAVTVKDDTLVIEIADTRKWYDHISVNFGSPKITVYIPQGEYGALYIRSDTGDLEIPKDFGFSSIDVSQSTGNVTSRASASEFIKIKTTTGNIYAESISAGSLELSVSTGKITVSDAICEGDITIGVSTGKTFLTSLECKSLTSSGNTGDISLTNVIAREKLSIERSTGDVKLDASDAADISIKTDTGDVKGSLLNGKTFITKTDTGRIDVPSSVAGGKCEISTDTGDIKITVN